MKCWSGKQKALSCISNCLCNYIILSNRVRLYAVLNLIEKSRKLSSVHGRRNKSAEKNLRIESLTIYKRKTISQKSVSSLICPSRILPRILNSVRLLSCRPFGLSLPSGLVLGATGFVSPKPLARSLFGSIPFSTR